MEWKVAMEGFLFFPPFFSPPIQEKTPPHAQLWLGKVEPSYLLLTSRGFGNQPLEDTADRLLTPCRHSRQSTGP
jgi:hypothetical protein